MFKALTVMKSGTGEIDLGENGVDIFYFRKIGTLHICLWSYHDTALQGRTIKHCITK